jgi:hypothetical protein
MTVVFPAFCPACGLIFESRLIAIEGQGRVEGLTLKGNREPCPNCGEEAQTLEGTFDVVDDTIEVLSASGLTWEALERVSAILEQARAGEMSTDAAVEAVTNEAPSFKPLLDRYGPRMRKASPARLGGCRAHRQSDEQPAPHRTRATAGPDWPVIRPRRVAVPIST